MDAKNHYKAQAGFTLYELLITVIIVGVVLSYGMANLAEFNQNGRMTATANDLHAAFHLARSESARARSNVTICASANPMAANANCGGTWDQGYIVFVDTNGDLNRAGADETILRRHGAVETGVNLNFVNGATYFSYASTGLGRGNVGGQPAVSQVVMCDSRGNVTAAGGNSAARLFVVTPLGRGTVLRDTAQIDGAGGCP
ncbi:MAG: GspH/FimT family pseudopilin [Woeseiaceae bacterium]|nr:GspH/FimT family pseudopilin [Woeseiaceae bacterium]